MLDTPSADLNNAENWEEVFNTAQAITELGPNSYIPLSQVQIPIFLSKPIIAVYTESPSALPHWTQAGWLNQIVPLGILYRGQQQGNREKSRMMLLKKIMVVEWDRFVGNYQLTFTPKRHLKDIVVKIWEYTGPIQQSLDEKVDLARIDVLRVEKQIQFIAQRDVETDYRVE